MDHISQFYYTGHLDHLTQGQANNVCSNKTNRKALPYSSTCLVYAKDPSNGKFYGQIGLVTGLSDKDPNEVWSEWNSDFAVYDVVWVTGLKVIPSELFVNQRMAMVQDDLAKVVEFLLNQSR